MDDRATPLRSKATRSVAVVAVATLLAAAVAALAARPEPVLEIPPPGEIASAELGDGTPVLVHHGADGQVHAVEAVAPARWFGLATLVGWCPQMDGYVEYWTASTWDGAGRWVGGPAPRDLARWPLERRGDVVNVVGPARVPDDRSPQPHPPLVQERWCDVDDGMGTPPDAARPARYHALADGVPVGLDVARGGGPVIMSGRLAFARDATTFCADPEGAGCAHEPLVLPGRPSDPGRTLWLHGRVHGRVEGTVLHDAVVLPGGWMEVAAARGD